MLSSGAMPAPRLPAVVLSLIALVALGLALGLRVPESKARSGFWSDEATYHSMAWSLAFDGDVRYERADLERVYAAGYGGGPSGLFLVRNPDTGGLFFAKSFAYPLFAAPFVRLLGDNGFFVLHALLLAAMLAAGYAYAKRATAPGPAALLTATYVMGSVLAVYFFWITPEWFNAALVFLATFLWLYKEPVLGEDRPPPARWLTGAWTDVAAAVLYGVAVYSKPPNALIVAPLLLWTLARRRYLRAALAGFACALVVAGFFGATWSWIGDWNYQGGDRRQFNVLTSYPMLDPDKTFDTTGTSMTTNVEDFAAAIPAPATLGRDLLYVWLGRNGGMLPYMFPAVAALALFVLAPAERRRWWSPQGLLAAFFLMEVVAIVVMVKLNWIGGGGTIGSRYFVNVYPLLFFVLPAASAVGAAVASWAVWALFVAQIAVNPFASSADPSMHTKRFPYTMLPAELTILHNLPFNTNPSARRVAMDAPPTFYTYFLDDGTYLRESDLGGFWIRGADTAELVVRTVTPARVIRLELRNRTRTNLVTVRHGHEALTERLPPGARRVLELPARIDHAYDGTILYRIVVSSDASTVPLFDTPGSGDTRALGVFVRLTVEPPAPIEP